MDSGESRALRQRLRFGFAGIVTAGVLHPVLILVIRGLDEEGPANYPFWDGVAALSFALTVGYVALYVAAVRGTHWAGLIVSTGKVLGLIALVTVAPWIAVPVLAGLVFGGVGTALLLLVLIGTPLVMCIGANVLAMRGAMVATARARRLSVVRSAPLLVPQDAPPLTLHAATGAALLAVGVPAAWFRTQGVLLYAALYAVLLVLTYRRSEVARRLLLLASGPVAAGILVILVLGAFLDRPSIAEVRTFPVLPFAALVLVGVSNLILPVLLHLRATRAFTVPPAERAPMPPPRRV